MKTAGRKTAAELQGDEQHKREERHIRLPRHDKIEQAAAVCEGIYTLGFDLQRPAKTLAGCSLNIGRALIAAATKLTRMTRPLPTKGVNHIIRKG